MPRQEFYGFELDIPEGWADASLLALHAPDADHDFRRNLVISVTSAAGKDVKAVAHEARKELIKQRFAHLKLVKEENKQIDGLPAIEIEFHHDMPPKDDNVAAPVAFIRRNVVVVKNDTVYSITITDVAEAYAQHRAEFDRLLNSLKLP